LARQVSVLFVTETIRDRILAGVYPAGHHLRESAIATDLKVSRTPVREALQRLAADGLIDLSRNRGARVTGFTEDELDEIFGLRVLLEGYGARLAATRMNDEALRRLQDLNRQMEAVAADTRETARESVAALNTRFHLLILETAGNERLRTLASSLVRIVGRSMFERYSDSDLSRSSHHHRELIDAFRATDGDWAEAVMRAHLLSGRRSVRE
jgi:DNA-binding GntR family transcriptional regulator